MFFIYVDLFFYYTCLIMPRRLKDLIRNYFRDQKPLFGEAIAREAREKGVTIHAPKTESALFIPREGAANALTRADDKLVNMLRRRNINLADGSWKTDNRLHVDFDGSSMFEQLEGSQGMYKWLNKLSPLHSKIESSKLKEAKLFPELISPTRGLAQIMRPGTSSKLTVEQFRDRILKGSPDGAIIKHKAGAATPGDSLITDKSDLSKWKHFHDRLSAGKEQASDYIVQNRINAQRANPLIRSINNIAETAEQGRMGDLKGLISRDRTSRGKAIDLLKSFKGDRLPFAAKRSISGNNNMEYRVHVINGKVVPYATSFRGGVTGNLPIRMPGYSKAEKALQAQLDKVGPERLQGSFAFDVLKDKAGKFHTVETNPTSMTRDGGFFRGAGSGMAHLGWVQDAIGSSIQGKLPRYVQAQRAAILGGVALPSSIPVAKSMMPRKEEELLRK